MKGITISCPKCLQPGFLYSKRPVTALIGSRPIAHVLHTDNHRHVCMLTRLEFERIRNEGRHTQRGRR